MVVTLALLGGSVVFALGAAEASLRLFPSLLSEEARLRLHWRDVSTEEVSKGHPYLGFVFPPHHEGEFKRPDGNFVFTYTTDEHGFRNPSPWPQRADLVVLGDSMAFGYGVDDGEAWTALLADRLPDSRIINLGLIGAAPQQYFRVYETFGQALQPNLVLFCLFPGNDVVEAGLFDRWLNEGAQGNYRLRRFSNDDDRSEPRVRKLLERSYLASFLRDVRRRSGSEGRTIEFADGGQLQLVPGLYARMADQTDTDHPNFRMVLDAVHQTRALAQRNGSEFLVVLVPTKEEVYLPLLDEEPPPFTAPFSAQFDEADVPYLDLTPHFRAGARRGERLFFEVDGHPNAAGYRLMADVVLDHLRNNAERYHLAGLE